MLGTERKDELRMRYEGEASGKIYVVLRMYRGDYPLL